MVIRAIALSLALLVGIGTIVPLATDTAEAGSKRSRKYKKQKRYKKYSKQWWRQYRARMKRKRALAARRRALRLRQLRLARARRAAKAKNVKKPVVAAAVPKPDNAPAMLPSGDAAPASWKKGDSNGGEIRFRVDNGSGQQIGTASISVVGPAMGDSSDAGRNKTLAGVPTTSLRREVINKMIVENGWVVNDYQKEIGGKKVYVVEAQSQAGGRVNSRMFYFTEVDGRIYAVSTNSSTDSAERIAEESEKVINSLLNRPRPMQRAALREE